MDTNEKEKDLGDNPSDVNPSQGGNMNAVHTPKIEENKEIQQEYGDQFDSGIGSLEDLTLLIGILMPRDRIYRNGDVGLDPQLENRMRKINLRAGNARDALVHQIEFLGQLFWQRSYSDECTDPPGPGDCNEIGQLIQNLGGMLRACIQLEENSRVGLKCHGIEV